MPTSPGVSSVARCRVVVVSRSYSKPGQCERQAGADGIHCWTHGCFKKEGRKLEYVTVTPAPAAARGRGGRRMIGDDDGQV